MSKITLTPISNPSNLTSLQTTINNNNTTLQTAFDNTLSRDGTAPDQMLSNLDMNSNQILNLPSPATPNSPARLVDVVSNPTILVPPVGTSGAVVGLLNSNNTYSGTSTFSGATTFNNTATFNGSVAFPANSIAGGDITNASVTSTQIATNTITNTNLAQMPTLTIKGNNTGGTANVTDLTAAQVTSMLSVIGNNTVNKTANYTVVNADNGSSFVLGGGTFFSLTFNVASSYSSTFAVRVINADVRGKTIVLTGGTSTILWPGQVISVFNCNNSWVKTDPGRWRKSGVQFFVDTANGNDSNDGLASTSGAFKTIGAALQTLYTQVDCANGSPQVNVANGIYTETITLQGQFTGNNVGFIVGASPSGVVWKPASTFCFLVSDNAEWEVQNIKFDNSGGSAGGVAVAVHQTGVLDLLSGCEFGTWTGGTHISMDHGGGSLNLPASYTVSGNAGTHIAVGGCCSVTMQGGGVVTISGTPTIGLWAQVAGSGANISFASGTTFSGSTAAGGQKYSAILNGSISLSGLTLPGTVAGATTTGGQAA